MKKHLILLLFLVFPCFIYGQISYRTRYKKAIYGELFAISPFASVGLEHAINRQMKSFTAIRYGLGFVPGSQKEGGGTENNGISMPLSFTRNFLVNNLKRRIKHRVSLKCNSMPSRVSVEWFGEGGLAYVPVFYTNQAVRHRYFAIIGFRQQVVFDVPPKPKVVFLRFQYTPQYYQKEFSWNPINSSGNIFGMSIGVSI